MEQVHYPAIPINFYQAIRRHVTEDCELYTRHHLSPNLKSRICHFLARFIGWHIRDGKVWNNAISMSTYIFNSS